QTADPPPTPTTPPPPPPPTSATRRRRGAKTHPTHPPAASSSHQRKQPPPTRPTTKANQSQPSYFVRIGRFAVIDRAGRRSERRRVPSTPAIGPENGLANAAR